MSTRIKFRRGTASEWTSGNPILSTGEPGFEKDIGKLKIGDGVTPWNSLAYFNDGASIDPEQSGNYSLVGHSHISDDITDFDSSVSGIINDTLDTTLIGGSGIEIIYSSGNNTLTISTTGLQPSGNYSLVGHSHSSSDITDFDSSVSGIVSSSLSTDILAGASIGLDYSTVNDTLTIYSLQESYITSLGSVSGTVPINYDPKNRSIQTLTLGGTATTLTKGTGWPIWVDFSTDVILKITVSSATTVTWSVVTEWYNQPPGGALTVDTHLILLRAIGNSIIEGHYIGRRTL